MSQLPALASSLRLGTTRQQSSSLTQFAWPRIILAPLAFSNEAKSYVDLRSLYLATTGRTSSSSSVGSASNDSSRRKRVKASSWKPGLPWKFLRLQSHRSECHLGRLRSSVPSHSTLATIVIVADEDEERLRISAARNNVSHGEPRHLPRPMPAADHLRAHLVQLP